MYIILPCIDTSHHHHIRSLFARRVDRARSRARRSEGVGPRGDERRHVALALGELVDDEPRVVDETLDEGVYCQFRGPQYETPAEVRMAKTIGGHIVGMSTALEAIAARQAGMEILGFSLITNMAAGIQTTPLSHQEVIEAGKAAEPVISALLARVIGEL